MNIKKIFLAGVVIWIVDAVITMLTCGWLFKWVYDLPPMIWKSPEALMTGSNIFAMQFISLIKAILFAFGFAVFFKGIPKEGIKKGIVYGIMIWILGPFSGITPMPTYMPIATGVIIYWLVLMFFVYSINGVIVAKIYHPAEK